MKIELRELTKRLGRTTVLDSVSLLLPEGQIIAILGANGAGKTTLLHLLGGLYQPDDGEILFDEEKLERHRLDLRRRLHYLPDIPVMSPRQTPIDYVLLALEAYGLADEDANQTIIELFEAFDLLPLADCPSSSLSRGQRYKATLCALIAIDPDFWILDEPFTSGMDPTGLMAMRQQLEAARDRGKTIVFSTQLIEVAQSLSDLVCILDASQIAAFGPINELETSTDDEKLLQLLEQLRS